MNDLRWLLASTPARAIDGLADDVGVAGVASGLLDHVYRNPPHALVDLVRPGAQCVEIEAAQDVVRGDDLFPVVSDDRCDRVSVGEPEGRVRLLRSASGTAGHSLGKLRPATMIWNHLRSQIAECLIRLRSESELAVGVIRDC